MNDTTQIENEGVPALSDFQKSQVVEQLRAILEALWRLDAVGKTLAEKVREFDVHPPSLDRILSDAGEQAFNVGADAIDNLEAILGIDIKARDDESDPFSDAFSGVVTDAEMLGGRESRKPV